MEGGDVSSGTLITLKGPVRNKLRTTFLHVAGPKRQVISEELHDQSRILVALFGERVEFGNRIVKRLLGEVACTVGRIEDLVVEYRKVERETEADWVGGWEFSDRNVRRGLVGLERFVGAVLALVASGELSKVTVVVAHPDGVEKKRVRSRHHKDKERVRALRPVGWRVRQGVGSKEAMDGTVANEIGEKMKRRKNSHLMVEDLGLARGGRGNEVLLENVEDVLADLCELSLDLLPVCLDHDNLGLIALGLFLLLNRRDDAPAGTAGADDVLVSDGEEVALFDGELLVRRRDALHVLNHF